MKLVTEQMLKDLGLSSVIVLPPVALVNGLPVVAAIHTYKTMDEMKDTDWFRDGQVGGLTLMCEGAQLQDEKEEEEEGYLVRLHVRSKRRELFTFSNRWLAKWYDWLMDEVGH
jgi:hypothetical protein